MTFDLSFFADFGKLLFDAAVNLYKSFNFSFGSFTVNGWVLLVGIAIVCIIIYFVGRILQ